VADWKATVIKGHLNLDFLTDDMLSAVTFTEHTDTNRANGYWAAQNIPPPDYPADCAMVHQVFGSNVPDWAQQIGNMFDWLHFKQVTINKLTPGTFIPPHVDSMYRLKQAMADMPATELDLVAVRINIFLTDHKIGHWLNIENHSFDKYNKGDYTFILPGQLHSVANIGYEPRFTMQVTGLAAQDIL
jgi:hypothetical protein